MNHEMLELAKLGIEAEAFLRSPLGKFLRKKAEDEIDAATQELIDCAPNDFFGNRDIRNKIHVARMFLVWVSDAINIGRAAHEQLDDE